VGYSALRNGNTNTGGGGAGDMGAYAGAYGRPGAGGSGIAVLRYPGAFRPATISANVTYTSDGANLIYTFTGSGTITF
jgi:hypothetical protein